MNKLKYGILGLLFSGCAIVGPDEAAVVHSFGSLDQNVYGPGIHGALFRSFEVYNVRQQVHSENLGNFTEDLQNVNAKVVIKYSLNPVNLVGTYKNIAANDETLYTNYVQPAVMSGFKAMVSKYKLEELVATREQFQDEAQKHLTEHFGKDKVVIFDSISIVDLTLDPKFTQAIEDKQIALQKLAQAKTEVEISEQEAKKMQALTVTLSDRMLTKMFLEKWDGKTPLYFQPSGVQLMKPIEDAK